MATKRVRIGDETCNPKLPCRGSSGLCVDVGCRADPWPSSPLLLSLQLAVSGRIRRTSGSRPVCSADLCVLRLRSVVSYTVFEDL